MRDMRIWPVWRTYLILSFLLMKFFITPVTAITLDSLIGVLI